MTCQKDPLLFQLGCLAIHLFEGLWLVSEILRTTFFFFFLILFYF